MVTTNKSHYDITQETKGCPEMDIMYLEEEENKSASLNSIRKVYDINNHKGSDQLI